MKDFYYLFLRSNEVVRKQAYFYAVYKTYSKLNIHADNNLSISIL